jgi:hypothetical protein
MSLFDLLRPKWKHPDPTVRESAVRELTDQNALESLAENDPVESIRLAAVHALTDQDALARIARGRTALALAAMERITDNGTVVQVALSAELRAVREMAVDRISDSVTLHRIASSDIDASVRLKARLKRMGPDQTRDYIRSELSKLQLAQKKAGEIAGVVGTLDDVCASLLGDGRFRINGGVDQNEPRVATIRELSAPPAANENAAREASSQDAARAQFLAFKRDGTGAPAEGATSNAFYEINVWRTDQDTFLFHAEEKRLKVVQDAVRWGSVANGTGDGTKRGTKTVAG